MTEDKEDLLAEALRAKAGQTGAAGISMAAPAAKTDRLRLPVAVPTGLTPVWILLLAVLLGVATGTIIGLLTVL